MAEYYRLELMKPAPGTITTCCLLDCSLCGENIAPMGGGSTAICVRCASLLRTKQLKGSVKHERTIEDIGREAANRQAPGWKFVGASRTDNDDLIVVEIESEGHKKIIGVSKSSGAVMWSQG